MNLHYKNHTKIKVFIILATNKNARLRYEALDKCLSDFSRKFYIEDLRQVVCQYLKDQLGEEMTVITMPSGVFQPYSGVRTAILIFTRTGTDGTDKVWFYDMRADGYSLTSQRPPQPDRNDIPDLVSRFHNLEAENGRDRKAQSFFVDAEEIRKNDYDLSYKRYHEVGREIVEYNSPETIIARMKERQVKIDSAFAEFQKLLNS